MSGVWIPLVLAVGVPAILICRLTSGWNPAVGTEPTRPAVDASESSNSRLHRFVQVADLILVLPIVT